MKGKLYIDGIDVYEKYGVFISKEGYNELLSFPEFKNLEINDWHEENGIEVNLLNPVLDSHTFTLQFESVNSRLCEVFLTRLCDYPYHTFSFTEIGYEKKLRLISHTINRRMSRLENFSLQLADDFPIIDEGELLSDSLNMVTQSGYNLDDIPFSKFGVFILDGSDEEIFKTPEVKENLIIDLQSSSGCEYDNSEVSFKSKEVGLKCLMRVQNLGSYWKCRNAMLHQLTQSGLHSLLVEKNLEEYSCYYKSWKVVRFEVLKDKSVWCEFVLNLVFTDYSPQRLNVKPISITIPASGEGVEVDVLSNIEWKIS